MSTLPSDERLDGGHRADGRHALAEEAAAGPRRASRLSVEDLEFEIGGVRILDRVSFSLARGELVCVMGPSGSGKTTLLKCLNRLLEPTGGRVFLDGADTASFSPVALRRRIGMVWQTPFMFEGTVRGNLRRAVQLSGSGVGDEMMPLDALSVWVDEPDAVYRRGLVSCLLDNGLTVSGQSVRLVPRPDAERLGMLVFDICGAGLREAIRLVGGTPVRLVGIAEELQERTAAAAIYAGVCGLLVRSELTAEAFVSCLRSAASGNICLPPDLARRLAGALPIGSGPRHGGLQERELDVLSLLAEGRDTREIATELSYSERTVKNIVQAILLKTNCRTRAHAVAIATRQGVI